MKRKKRIKEISITKLRNKAWDLQSEYIRRIEKGKCFTCGDKKDWKKQQAGHFVHGHNMDFVKENIHCQCVKCNYFLSGNLIEYAIKLEKKYGFGIVQKLKHLGDQIKKWKVQELLDIIEENKEKIAQLDKNGGNKQI